MSVKSKKTSKKIKQPEVPLVKEFVEEETDEEEEGYVPLSAGAPAADHSASLKNFRHHPDMENFYRFIYENDLRYEALQFLEKLLAEHAKK